MGRCIRGSTVTGRAAFRVLILAAGIALTAIRAWPQEALKAVTDNVSYNVGSEVRLKIILPPSGHYGSAPFDISANIFYAGEEKYLLEKSIKIARSVTLGAKESATDYRTLWKIPEDARTGRYEVIVALGGSQSVLNSQQVPHATFSVYRKLVKIERIQLDRTFYTPGDAVACKVVLRNLTGRSDATCGWSFPTATGRGPRKPRSEPGLTW